jgi:hypothetical protein
MALLEVIEWPVAIVIAVGHEISHRVRSRVLREFAEGIEAGAAGIGGREASVVLNLRQDGTSVSGSSR